VTAGTLTSGDGKALLNLGCGTDYHSAFVNIDLVAAPGVISHDLRQGIPFPDGTCDLVYHSTMLSHLRPGDALSLMRECHRVLKPHGVCRAVTEDLEQMCRVYLQKLEAAWDGNQQSAEEYKWMLLEIYDQATREYPGGEMARYLSQTPLPSEAFIYARIGEPGKRMVSWQRSRSNGGENHAASRPAKRRTMREGLVSRVRQWVLTAALGRDGLKALEVGRFRLSSGQVSYRMYDRYSLKQLFLAAGFADVVPRTATESGYARWDAVNLDVAPDGQPARPHALIVEGTRQ
jgi:SAM-dependent methyltransferase